MVTQSGTPLLIHDLNNEAIQKIVGFGATAAEPKEICARCEVVFICLPGDTEVENFLIGEQGFLDRHGKTRSIIDTSTISFVKAREFAAKAAALDIVYSDCPVSGLPKRAWDGSLTMMFGGEAEQFALAKPYLDMMGKQVLHCGEVGAGQMTKAINNIIYNINITGFCEVLPLAVKAGLDPEMLADLVLGGSSRSFASEHFVPRIMQGKFEDDFPMQLAYKDIVNVQKMAEAAGVETPLVDAMTGTYEKAIASGYGQQPKSAMIKVYEEEFGVKVRKKAG